MVIQPCGCCTVLEQGKWVNNVIGLLNHREFVLMLVGRQPS